ncbi:MAG: FxLYD domain-containing protein [Candidatus Pacebacteria bacterium]|nr:FxLYD domain-containing protein [Candidatus Paceibacterota bacterium]
MSWADRRKHVIEAIVAAVAVALVAIVLIATLYKTPSCADGKQNQGEQGIDCGGPCPYACSAYETPPSVRFARAVSPQQGRTDVIAYIDNANADAELQAASYSIQLYGPNQTIIAQKTGTVTIPPSTTAPVFIPDFLEGTQPVTQVFVTLDSSTYRWLRTTKKPVVPIPSNIQTQETLTPKITATLSNPTAQPLTNVTVIATVFDSSNNAIAASQTVVPVLPAQGSASVIFTWNQPFASTPAYVEILPAVLTSL